MKKMLKIGSSLAMIVLVVTIFSSCKKEKTLPVAGFTYAPTTVVAGVDVTFTNTTTDGVTYAWNFGDSNTSTDKDPVHLFVLPGDYTVTLTATNGDGINEISKVITVAVHPNVFTIDGTSYEIPVDKFVYEYLNSQVTPPTKHWRVQGIVFPTAVTGKTTLVKLLPNLGLHSLEGTYTFGGDGISAAIPSTVDKFSYGITESYAGMTFTKVDFGKAGVAAVLKFTKLNETIWKIQLTGGKLVSGGYPNGLSAGWFADVPAKEYDFTIDYVGTITPAAK